MSHYNQYIVLTQPAEYLKQATLNNDGKTMVIRIIAASVDLRECLWFTHRSPLCNCSQGSRFQTRWIRAQYINSVSCVRASQSESASFTIETGVRQECVLAPDSFTTGVDWLLERTVGTNVNECQKTPSHKSAHQRRRTTSVFLI